jgi:hypothetical protein
MAPKPESEDTFVQVSFKILAKALLKVGRTGFEPVIFAA